MKIGTVLDQQGQQWPRDSKAIPDYCSKKSLKGLSKSMNRLDRTLRPSPLLFALALGRDFRHNFATPTILDGVAKSDNTRLLIRLEDNSLVLREVKVGHQSPCWVRVHPHPSTALDDSKCLYFCDLGTMRTGNVSCAPSSGCPKNPQSTEIVGICFCLLCFRINSAMTKRKSSATNACRAPTSKLQMGNVVRFHFSFGWHNRSWNMPQIFCLPGPYHHQRIHQLARDQIHQHARDHFPLHW